MKIYAQRYHDFSFGHRVAGHENCCAFLHGHNLRITFKCEAPKLDAVGRVIDFSVIKTLLCDWLEDNWDHRFLLWDQDPMLDFLTKSAGHVMDHCMALEEDGDDDDASQEQFEVAKLLVTSLVAVPFNPTSEGIAEHLLKVIGPQRLAGTGVTLTSVQVDETRKCSAIAEL
jgi:6-pyruvoyltetrahydropterin/6-carboxytetrahydropterin synthase